MLSEYDGVTELSKVSLRSEARSELLTADVASAGSGRATAARVLAATVRAKVRRFNEGPPWNSGLRKRVEPATD